AYDSLDCPQQKCLIHLMRDINDDLHKEPFNEEMKLIAYSFAALLKPIVETVDQFGLKARHLHKHRRSVDRFYDALSQRNYQNELATGYRRRFEKYRARRRRVPARVRPSHRSLEVYSVLLRGQYWIGTEHKFAGARPRPIFQK